MKILRELAFRPHSSFSDLNIDGLTNDHFSYHIRTLVEMGYVDKNFDGYVLSNKGKTYVTHMDTDKSQIEKLPKVSVLVIAEKTFKGVPHYAVATRTKEPYFGYTGFITGKMRYGETVSEAAKRELKEEMGLEAKIKHCFVLHEMVYDAEGKQLEDKFFNVVEAYDIAGELLEKTKEGKNRWVTEQDLEKINPKFHNEMEIFYWFKSGTRLFKEKKYTIKEF